MKSKSLFASLAVGVILVASHANADTKEVDIVNVRVGGSYVELEVSASMCSGNGIAADWTKRPRIEYGSTPERAQAVQALATAALLSGRKVTVRADVSGSNDSARCYISGVWLAK